MKLIRIFIHPFICLMVFQHSVSAGSFFIPAATNPPRFIPVKTDSSRIISFNSVIHKKKVSLNWIVTSNEEINQFEIERSTDGKKFELAGLIFGTENAGMDNYYFFEKLKRSKTYYRVKTITKDGSVSYSKVIIAGTI